MGKRFKSVNEMVKKLTSKKFSGGFSPSPDGETPEPNIQSELDARVERYGHFRDHAVISQALQNNLRFQRKWERMHPAQKEALTMICHKMARIVNGNPDYIDNWFDIAGYATLVVNILKTHGEETSMCAKEVTKTKGTG